MIEDKDKYLLNPCSARKWVVIELCEEVQLFKLSLAVHELFAGMVKTFQVQESPTPRMQMLTLA